MKTTKNRSERAESIIRNLYHLYCKQSGEKIDEIHIKEIELKYRVQKNTDGMETFIPRRLIDIYQRDDDENSGKILNCFKNFREVI